MLEQPADRPHPKPKAKGKLDKLSAGQYIAYSLSRPGKVCTVGRVWTITRAEASIVVHKHKPSTDGRLRVKWRPVFTAQTEAGGHEVLDAGAAPSLEQITVQQVLAVVQLHDGVMSHAAARRLDKAGWTLDREELHVEALTVNPRLQIGRAHV